METSVEKIKAMFDAGKITVEQYNEMLKSIPDISTIPSSTPPESNLSTPTSQSQILHRPWQVWFCTIFLLVVAIDNIFSQAFLAMIICVVIAVPLFYRSRIAYVIIQIIGIVTIVYCIINLSILGLIINTAFVIILSSVWKYYFIRSE
ncbi:MAG: hypothetical protein ACE14V_12035 [bacterium]